MFESEALLQWHIAFYAIAAAAFMVGVIYGLPIAFRLAQRAKWLNRKGRIALTYDDGPDASTTPALLDLLDELDVAATFYLVGFRAESCPVVVERLRASRHELGTHSYSHKHAWKRWPWFEYRDSMRAYDTLAGIVDHNGAFRPPFGKVSLFTMLGMWLRGRRVQWWTTAALDHLDAFEDPNVVADRMVSSGRDVVLMHCHHLEPHRREYMLRLTRALVTHARERGLEITTMEQFERVAK